MAGLAAVIALPGVGAAESAFFARMGAISSEVAHFTAVVTTHFASSTAVAAAATTAATAAEAATAATAEASAAAGAAARAASRAGAAAGARRCGAAVSTRFNRELVVGHCLLFTIYLTD